MMRGRQGGVIFCSSGFGIILDGVSRTTTARHCNSEHYDSWDALENFYGLELEVSGEGGKVLASSGYHQMYDGAWNDPGGRTKDVVGLRDLAVGEDVCTSGGMSGVHCNIKINSLREWWNDPSGGPIPTITATQQQAFQIAGAAGDSGGPVLVPYPENDWSTVGAAGMIQWGQGTPSFSCGSMRLISAPCFIAVGFTSMRTHLQELGTNRASLMVAP